MPRRRDSKRQAVRPATPKPTINAEHGVVNAASLADGIAPNTWVTIRGANLATTTRTWTTDEIAGGALPQSLDKVSVTINNRPAYVQYVNGEQPGTEDSGRGRGDGDFASGEASGGHLAGKSVPADFEDLLTGRRQGGAE